MVLLCVKTLVTQVSERLYVTEDVSKALWHVSWTGRAI